MRFTYILIFLLITSCNKESAAKPKVDYCKTLEISDADLQSEIDLYKQDYGIAVVIHKTKCAENPIFECDAVTDEDAPYIYDYLQKTKVEFQLYPQNFLSQTAKLLEISFAKDLRGKEQDGIAGLTLTDGISSTININADAIRSCDKNSYRRITHHEIGHVLDNNRQGQQLSNYLSFLNPKGFIYGSQQSPEGAFFRMDHPLKGFVSYYAAASPQEDFAELYSLFFADFPESRLQGWISQDPSLRAKLSYLSAELAKLSTELTEKLPNYSVIGKYLQ